MQVGTVPDAEDCLKNWNKLQEHVIDFSSVEDKAIWEYIRKFYGQMAAPPDFGIVREFFEKEDNIEAVTRLDEIKNAQPFIGTNYLAIVRAEEDKQQVKNFMLLMRDASVVAEHGRNLDKPVNGKKVLKGITDAVGFVYDKLHDFTRVEGGEKLEGVVTDDAEEILQEYDTVEKTDKYAGRNLFGLEPVDAVCRGHRQGEYWIHTAFAGELKCVAGSSIIYDHAAKRRRRMDEVFESGDMPVVTALYKEGAEPKLVQARVSHVLQNGVRHVYEVKLESGRATTVTNNHGFWTPDGWKYLGKLSPGDLVAVPCSMLVPDPNEQFTDMEVEITGGCLRRVPDEFFGLPEHQVILLLRALWSRVSLNKRNGLKYYSASHGLCVDIQSLLLRLGIKSTITSHKIKYNGKSCPVWIVKIVETQSKRRFLTLTPYIIEQNESDSIANSLHSVDDNPHSSLPGMHPAVSQQSCNAADNDICWERIRTIASKGRQMTYDMSVPEHHSFVVDDIITHNTSLALNYAYNNAYVYGKNIFYAILEMPYKQLRRQLYVIHSSHGKFVTEWWKEDERIGIPPERRYTGLDYRRVRDGELSPRDKERLKKVAQDFKATSKGKLFVWRPPDEAGILEIRRKAEMFHNKWGCDGVVIDHLGLVKPRHRTSDFVTTQNAVVRDGRLMALNFARGRGVPVLALFQMNRQGKLRADKNDGRYDMAAISYANECNIEGTLVQTQLGLVPIERIKPGVHRVWSSTGWKEVLNCFDNGVREVFKLKTNRGQEAVVTGSHRFRSLVNGKIVWAQVSDMQLGDMILTDFDNNQFPIESPDLPPLEVQHGEHSFSTQSKLTEQLAYLMGAHAGDGVFVRSVNRRPGIPLVILQAPRSMVITFIQGIMDTYGCVSSQGIVNIGLRNEMKPTLLQLQLLFAKLGIETTVYDKRASLNSKKSDEACLRIRSHNSRELFARLVGFTEPSKQEKLMEFVYKFSALTKAENTTSWPVGSTLRAVCAKHQGQFTRKTNRVLNSDNDHVPHNAFMETLNTINDVGGNDVSELRTLATKMRPHRIASIEKFGSGRVFDLEVTGDHEYSTGGFFSHNCEKSADVITWTYLNDQLRKEGKFYMGNLKNRDNPIFERMIGKIFWMSKRMRAIESMLIDINNDSIVSASNFISTLQTQDLFI
jgi:intein/homing endonuclease